MQTEFAPAKINLTLHVTGQRPDGYHLLDSLVVFASVGDWVSAELSQTATLTISGPMAAGLHDSPNNLVQRAAALMNCAARLHLEKHLPVSSGIGGGSADAAATLRLLARLSGRALPPAAEILTLGADVPVCIQGQSLRMRGVGEKLTPIPPLPEAWLVLVNPGVGVSTPHVFKVLETKTNPPLPETIPAFASASDLAAFLKTQRNDLEAPAQAIAPQITVAKARLGAAEGCLLARMSGSGATCFGLFGDEHAAKAAEKAISQDHPKWWVAPAKIL